MNGVKKTLDAHRIKAPEGDTDLTGNPVEWDVNRMWAFIDDKQLVKIQYFVFDPIFVDVNYFGFNQVPKPPMWVE